MGDLFDDIGAGPAFNATVSPYLVLDAELHIRAANTAYLEMSGRRREQLIGEYIFDAFPADPSVPDSDGVVNLGASLERVLSSGRRHAMGIQRYDVVYPDSGGDFVEKRWCPVNSPITGDDGRAAGILHHVEDVSDLFGARVAEPVGAAAGAPLAGRPAVDDEIAWRTRDLVTKVKAVQRIGAGLAAENENLRTALLSRATIDQAVGIVMSDRRCGPDEAFALLAQMSQNTNIKLRDIAAALVNRAWE